MGTMDVPESHPSLDNIQNMRKENMGMRYFPITKNLGFYFQYVYPKKYAQPS